MHIIPAHTVWKLQFVHLIVWTLHLLIAVHLSMKRPHLAATSLLIDKYYTIFSSLVTVPQMAQRLRCSLHIKRCEADTRAYAAWLMFSSQLKLHIAMSGPYPIIFLMLSSYYCKTTVTLLALNPSVKL